MIQKDLKNSRNGLQNCFRKSGCLLHPNFNSKLLIVTRHGFKASKKKEKSVAFLMSQ